MTCPVCGEALITPIGPEQAAIFLAGEYPGVEEIATGIPFKGGTGDVLRSEIFRFNAFKYRDCRIGNLWLHKKTKTCDLTWHVEQFLDELRKHKVALLMGSEFGKGVLYEGSVNDRVGLTIDIAGVRCVIAPQPASIVKAGGSVGEFRFALRTLSKLILDEEDE
jgi:uracil-DNA glycosylase